MTTHSILSSSDDAAWWPVWTCTRGPTDTPCAKPWGVLWWSVESNGRAVFEFLPGGAM